MSEPEVFRFDIEGQEVVCYQTGGDRLWRCQCERFQRNLQRFGEGFCPHTDAVAMMREMQDGTISVDDVDTRGRLT